MRPRRSERCTPARRPRRLQPASERRRKASESAMKSSENNRDKCRRTRRRDAVDAAVQAVGGHGSVYLRHPVVLRF